MAEKRYLLAVIELGGYPDFSPIYKSLGYEVELVSSVRNAIRSIKKRTPDVVVAEFNFQSDFRDRTSSLESLLSSLQRSAHTRVIVFYEKEFQHQLDKLQQNYTLASCLSFPIEEQTLASAIESV